MPAARAVIAAAALLTAAASAPAAAMDAGEAAAAAAVSAARMFAAEVQLQPVPLQLTRAQKKALRKRAGVRIQPKRMQAWRVAAGGQTRGWFFVDRVIGKHEYITYGLGLNAAGEVLDVEIFEYLESYGYEVEEADWRAQFHGKSLANNALRFAKDIDGISGATLSARNITNGVRKLLLLRELLLQQAAAGAKP